MNLNPIPMSSSHLKSLLLALSFTLNPQLALRCAAQEAPTTPSASPTTTKYATEFAAFRKADAENPISHGGIIFTGSSSIRLWKTLSSDFPTLRVINRGFGGSTSRETLEHYDLLIKPHQPRQVVIYVGSNDISRGASTNEVLETLASLFDRIHADFPNAKIAYISIAPNPKRWSLVEHFKTINATVQSWTQQRPYLDFINVFPKMLGTDGLPLPDIFVSDNLHMNPKGYSIWKEIVAPHLLPEPPR